MDCRRLRLSALVIIVVTTLLGVATPAFAGTLTSASFTASTPYTYTNAQNTRYDYGFTTATTSTISKVTATVPAGTGGSNRYLALPGVTTNDATTPDSVTNSITGSFDIRAQVAASDWTPASLQNVVAKYIDSGNQRSYALRLNTDGTLGLLFSYAGTDSQTATSSSAVGAIDGTISWVRVTYLSDNGGGNSVASFYKSADGSSWTSLGSVNKTVGNIYDSTTPLVIGARNAGGYEPFAGRVYYAEVRNGINGTVANRFDPSEVVPTSPTSWNASTGETWTIQRTAIALPADITTDLNVGPVTGVPSGGTANYRFIDGTASYYFPTATSIPASTPCTINLGGFFNTATAGSYASTIKTWDNAGTPAQVDTATTSTLAFTDYSSSQTVSATVDPSFAFTVGNQSSACNGESNFITTAGAASAVALGHLAASSNVSGGQALSIASNAGNGFAVYVRGAQSTQNLRSAGYNWTDVAGTYASPAILGASERFGYTYKDSTTSTSVTNPGSATFAKLDNATTNKVMGSTTSMTGSGCVSFDAQTGSATPAGSYTATVVYTAVPSF